MKNITNYLLFILLSLVFPFLFWACVSFVTLKPLPTAWMQELYAFFIYLTAVLFLFFNWLYFLSGETCPLDNQIIVIALVFMITGITCYMACSLVVSNFNLLQWPFENRFLLFMVGSLSFFILLFRAGFQESES